MSSCVPALVDAFLLNRPTSRRQINALLAALPYSVTVIENPHLASAEKFWHTIAYKSGLPP
jgi:hypothetical protein